jgi:hypothetical protein
MPLGFERFSLKGDKSTGLSAQRAEENAAPVAAAASSKEAPPSYAVTDPVQPIDGPTAEQLSAAFSSLRLSDLPPAFPTTDHCLAHLKLLSAFHALKEDVGYTDGLFNLWDAKCELLDNRDEALAKMREKRWVLYIARAVERFEDWWLKDLCNRENSKRLECKEMMANVLKFTDFTKRGRALHWTVSMLPPLGMGPLFAVILYANTSRCPHGMARIHAESSKLPRRLSKIRAERPMGYWYSMVCSQHCN